MKMKLFFFKFINFNVQFRKIVYNDWVTEISENCDEVLMSRISVLANELNKGYLVLFILILALSLFGFYNLNEARIRVQENVMEEMLHAFIMTTADGISVGYFQWDDMYEAVLSDDHQFMDAFFEEITVAFPLVKSVELKNMPLRSSEKYKFLTTETSIVIEFGIFNSDMSQSFGDKSASVIIDPQIIFENSIHRSEPDNSFQIVFAPYGDLESISVKSTEKPIEVFHIISAIGISLLGVFMIHTFRKISVSAHYEIEGLANIVMLLSQKDAYTAEHSKDVAKYALVIADKLGMNKKSRRILNKAGYLHDIGKIGISESILNKNGKLTIEEYEEIKKHSIIGYEIVSQFPNLKDVAIVVKFHHELLDGSGYPDGLKGDEIPLEAQVLAVADVFSALTTDRPYREGFNYWKAFEIMTSMPLNQEMVTILKAHYTIH